MSSLRRHLAAGDPHLCSETASYVDEMGDVGGLAWWDATKEPLPLWPFEGDAPRSAIRMIRDLRDLGLKPSTDLLVPFAFPCGSPRAVARFAGGWS